MNVFSHRPALVWGVLCTLTVTSVGVAGSGRWHQIAEVLIVLAAAAKARLVVVHYMELRSASAHWRVLYEIWIVAAAAAMLIGSFMRFAA